MDNIQMFNMTSYSESGSDAPLIPGITNSKNLHKVVFVGSKRKDRKNIFSSFFGKEKEKKKVEPNKENDEDMFDILTRVQGSR